ncbi:MAG: response regulator [Rickettsiales bacterium]|nr:response regulator [Rickettsiales bacterium]
MKALVVDDSKVVRSVISSLLESFSIAYEQAENGLIALEKVRKSKFDFILLDWNMPELDGIGFLQKSKAENLIADTKIILCTTENEFEKISLALESGASEYIMKPFNKDILEDKLKILGIIG